MGTSTSSSGPGGNVSLVPEWVPSVESSSGGAPDAAAEEATPVDSATQQVAQPASPPPASLLTPARGFAGVRRSLGTFARAGSSTHMRRSLSHYVRTSYRGAGNATRRHGGTIKTAASLYAALSPGVATPGAQVLDLDHLEGESADEVMDAIVEAVRPVDGTQDAEASRASIREALSELLEHFPNADLLELTEEQRSFAIERYVALDVYRRFVLDVGDTIQEKASDIRTGLSRLKEVRDYIRETISASFRGLRSEGTRTSVSTIGRLVQMALQNTFSVFESYTV